MREIKFRVWHDEAKDMVYFGLGEDHLKAYSLEDDSNYTLDLEHGYPVMQYTGLKDKNGNEIYEGDIIKEDGRRTLYQVVSGNEHHFVIAFLPRPKNDEVLFNEVFKHKKCKIIGNVYTNPELLGGKDERKVL